jgi:phage terminase large subunit
VNLEIALTPKQTEFDRLIEKKRITFYGGAKGGGKSHGLRNILLKRRIQYPGSVAYLFRKTYAELESNHIRPLFKQFPALKEYYREGNKTLTLPNGSELSFAYVEHKKDLPKFQGREMNDLAIEEAGEWEYSHYEYLQTQSRSATAGVPVRTMLTGNPGGVGHKWLKRLFIDKRFEGTENPDDYGFISAKVEDNPALMYADPDYARRLEGIKNEMLRRAFRHGDWDIAAGQFFSEFRRDLHVLPRTFKIQDSWPRFGGYDYGFSHPCAFGWWAADEQSNIYLYREFIEPRLRIDQQAKAVLQYPETKRMVFWAGRDAWGARLVAKEGMPPTIAEEFSTHSVYLRPANVDRKQGAARIREFLAVRDVGGVKVGPKLFILENCSKTIECLNSLTHDPDDPEDTLKIDATDEDPFSGDDAYDGCVRYPVMSRNWAAPKNKPKWRDKYDDDRPNRATWTTA